MVIYDPKRNKRKMKTIFLDHDGVICLSTEWGGRYKKQKKWGELKMSMGMNQIPIEFRFDNFNKKAIKILNSIIEETGAEIVVSSDWKRWATVEEMGQYYESQGIIKKPIAFTPNLSECTNYGEDFPWNRNWDLEQTRTLEINQYLKDHPEVTEWVAIDDLNMGKEGMSYSIKWVHDWGLDNFVLTPKGNEGLKQSGIKEKVLSFLT
jgi:hypothetical protein